MILSTDAGDEICLQLGNNLCNLRVAQVEIANEETNTADILKLIFLGLPKFWWLDFPF